MDQTEHHEMCKEMLALRELLDALHIDWTDGSDLITEDRIAFNNCYIYRTHFYYNGDRYSVVYGYGTYGGWGRWLDKEDPKLLELRINNEEPTGYHTAADIIWIMNERQGEREK